MASGPRGTSGTDGTKDTTITEKTARRGIVNMLKVKRARTKGIIQTVTKKFKLTLDSANFIIVENHIYKMDITNFLYHLSFINV